MVGTEDEAVIAQLEATGQLTLTLNRPAKRNALDSRTLGSLSALLDRYAHDEQVKVAVVTGAGQQSYAAGGDLAELAAIQTERGAAQMSRDNREILDKVRNFPVPVIAAINGDALGGGAELAVACDLRITASHARVGFIQGSLAITTAWGGVFDLISLVGPARALSLLSRSDKVAAEEALAIGLVDHVARSSQNLSNAVEELCQPMLSKPRHVLAGFKAAVRAARAGLPREQLSALETASFAAAWVHEAHWKAMDRLGIRNKE